MPHWSFSVRANGQKDHPFPPANDCASQLCSIIAAVCKRECGSSSLGNSEARNWCVEPPSSQRAQVHVMWICSLLHSFNGLRWTFPNYWTQFVQHFWLG